MAEKFWNSLKVWSQKPHVVNKRLAGVASVASWKCVSQFSSWENIVEKHLEIIGLNEQEIMEKFNGSIWSKAEHWAGEEHLDNTCFVSLRKCLPKQPHRYQSVFELEFMGVYFIFIN